MMHCYDFLHFFTVNPAEYRFMLNKIAFLLLYGVQLLQEVDHGPSGSLGCLGCLGCLGGMILELYGFPVFERVIFYQSNLLFKS